MTRIKYWYTKANLTVRLFLCFVYFSSQAYSQVDLSGAPLEQARKYFLDLELDSCEELIVGTDQNPEALYLLMLTEATRAIVADHEESYEAYEGQIKNFEDLIDQGEFSDSFKAFLHAELDLHHAIVKLKYGDEFSAFWSLRRAYNQASGNIEKFPDFLPSSKTLGFLYVVFGVVPDKYEWLLTLVGIKGNVAEGQKMMNQLYQSNNFLSIESGLILATVTAYLLNDPDAASGYIEEINKNNPSLLGDYLYALILIKNSESEKSWQAILNSNGYVETKNQYLPHFHYLEAEIHLQRGEYDRAISKYEEFVEHQNGQNLIKDAYYKTGISYYLQSDEEQKEKYFELARSSGWAKNEADRYAETQLGAKKLSAQDIYRIRYATDGGYLEQALKIQQNVNPSFLDSENRSEYYYRSGRLMHKLKRLKEAIHYYQLTIKNQKEPNLYFAPNAALQAGILFEAQGQRDSSEYYLKQVYDYDNHPYQRSIRRNARNLLRTLKKAE